MASAIRAAWGDGQQVDACASTALGDYNQCLESRPAASYECLLALLLGHLQLSHYIDVSSRAWEELGSRLMHYVESPNADSLLVRGFELSGNLDDEWVPSFPSGVVSVGSQRWDPTNGMVYVDFPSAFHVFCLIPDYEGANAVLQRCPDAVVTPGLRAWRSAVRGFVCPEEAVERFAEAAQLFSGDAPDLERQGTWNSVNVDLWAKYFRARAALATIVREPQRICELLREATQALRGTDSGWVNANVSRLRVLVGALFSITCGNGPGASANTTEYLWAGEQTGGEDGADHASIQFLRLVNDALQGYRNQPEQELDSGRLSEAIGALDRIPLHGPGMAEAIGPGLRQRAVQLVRLGPDRTWVHRTLESIEDESVLRKLLLRLLRAAPAPPAYAHIRHGPLEYGKDVAVLLAEGDRSVLRMYQVKCGDINSAAWRIARQELEEMFDVDLPKFQLPGVPDEKEGILFCNGHANIYAETAMSGWFEKQLLERQRKYSFMHLDQLVKWIERESLYGELRRFCSEVGLEGSL
jgi:hypothetical protein